MLLQLMYNRVLFPVVLLIVSVILAICFMRLSSRKIRKNYVSFKEIDPDQLPNLQKKVFWVTVQTLIGLGSLIVFIVFGIKNLLSQC